MPDPVSAIVGVGSQVLGSAMQGEAAEDAASIQAGASEAGIAEQRRQFDAVQKLLQPYVQAGTGAVSGLQPYAAAGAPALSQMQALAGLSGAGAQRGAISALEGSPLFQAQVQQGENAMLQNASATGGLRGGNLQAAMAQFRPQMLQAEIERQYGRLGGLTALGQTTSQNLAQMGQASAAGVGTAGMQSAGNIAALLGEQAAAQSGGVLGQARAISSGIGGINKGLSSYYSATGQSPFSGFGAQSSSPGLMQELTSYGVF